MFSPSDKRRKGSITVHPALRRAASLARAFILLEDPELSGPRAPGGESVHPHRVPLRTLEGPRRPGAGVPRAQHCLTPVAVTGPPVGKRTWKRTADPVRVGACATSQLSR
jgi:hypothetical protein